MTMYPTQPTHQSGFTLVEMMVTIAILGIVLAIGAPLTSAWIDRAKVKNTANSLKSALMHARTAALRNPNNLSSTDVASCVYINGDNAEVRLLITSGGSCTTTTTTVIKSFPLSLSGTEIKQGSTKIDSGRCFAFNSNGMSDTTSPSTSPCTTDALSSTAITIRKGNESATVDFI